MATKKKTPVRKSTTGGLKKYQAFMKSKTKRESDKVTKLVKELAAARKAKAAATKKASAAWKRTKK
jgi:hypothetical protein